MHIAHVAVHVHAHRALVIILPYFDSKLKLYSSMAEVHVYRDVGEDVEPLASAKPVRVRWYNHWIFATVMLCCYGFFKEFKPSEPFLTPYLTSDIKNFTKDQVCT